MISILLRGSNIKSWYVLIYVRLNHAEIMLKYCAIIVVATPMFSRS
jgi:hypothetical protein